MFIFRFVLITVMCLGEHLCSFIMCSLLFSVKHWFIHKHLQMMESKRVVDKKQGEFSIKKMIKRLHIKEPAEHVMAILGKK